MALKLKETLNQYHKPLDLEKIMKEIIKLDTFWSMALFIKKRDKIIFWNQWPAMIELKKKLEYIREETS